MYVYIFRYAILEECTKNLQPLALYMYILKTLIILTIFISRFRKPPHPNSSGTNGYPAKFRKGTWNVFVLMPKFPSD